jgi:GTPase SAR1 family protein
MYYRGANAAIICYDITSASSWNMVDSWLQELRRNMTTKLGNISILERMADIELSI